jgi:hypothetical protein
VECSTKTDMKNTNNYLKWFFSNKISLFLLLQFTVITFLLGLWVVKVYDEMDLYAIVYVVFIVLLAFYFLYFRNDLNYLKIVFYRYRLTKQGINYNNNECIIELFERDMKTTGFRDSRTVTIKTPPRKTKCNCLISKNWILVFCKLKYLGVFKVAINPVLIELTDKQTGFPEIKKNRIVASENISYKGNDLVVLVKNSSIEVRKIIIPDIKSILV